MPYEWLEDYCASKKGAVKEFKPEWNALRYMVGGKMFALQGEDNMGRPIISCGDKSDNRRLPCNSYHLS